MKLELSIHMLEFYNRYWIPKCFTGMFIILSLVCVNLILRFTKRGQSFISTRFLFEDLL